MGGCSTKQESTDDFMKDEPNYQKQEFVSEENKISDIIQLYFTCTTVKKLGMAAEPSTKIVVKELIGGDEYKIIGETEIIEENNNPKFNRCVQASYNIQEAQEFRIELYESSPGQSSEYLPEKLCLGTVNFLMHELIKSANKSLTFGLKEKKKKTCGIVCINYERIISSKKANIITINAEINPVNKADVGFYYKIYRDKVPVIEGPMEIESGDSKEAPKLEEQQLLYDSKYGGLKENIVTYSWKPLKISYTNFCQENPNMQLTIEVGYKINSEKLEDNKAENKSTWFKKFTVSKLQQSELTISLDVNEEHYGVFKLFNPVIAEERTFLDYINKGLNLKLCIGLDWTVSNNLPNSEIQFHNKELNKNPYCLIMRSLGKAILCFDSFQSVPVIAFGGSLPDIGRSSCFALNGKIFEPEVIGLMSVIELYVHALKKAKLGGPSYFADVLKYYDDYITEYMDIAYNECPRYFVLLIITDGSPLDYDETMTELVKLSSLPISVVFIGINPELCQPFQEVLEKPDLLVSETLKRTAERNAIIYYNYEHDPDKLLNMAKYIFSILQKQVVEYMSMHNFEPKDPALLKNKMLEPPAFNAENVKVGNEEVPQKLDSNEATLLKPKSSEESPEKTTVGEKNPAAPLQLANETKEIPKEPGTEQNKNEEKPKNLDGPVAKSQPEEKSQSAQDNKNEQEKSESDEAEKLDIKRIAKPPPSKCETLFSPIEGNESPLKSPDGIQKENPNGKVDQPNPVEEKKEGEIKSICDDPTTTPNTMIPKETPKTNGGPTSDDNLKGGLDASSIAYVMMLNKFKRAAIKRRAQFKKEIERIDAHGEELDLKKEEAKKALTEDEKKEEERKQKEDFERIEELITTGFPVRDPQVIIETIKNKDFKNALLVDPSMKNLIIQTQN